MARIATERTIVQLPLRRRRITIHLDVARGGQMLWAVLDIIAVSNRWLEGEEVGFVFDQF